MPAFPRSRTDLPPPGVALARLVVPIVLAVASVSFAAGPRAMAQDDRREARSAFASGERAFAEDDYPLALEHFRRAFELGRHDAVRFNIAVCLERLGRSRAAALEYDAAAASSMLEPRERARARSLATRARARLGVLVVEGRPEGAAVLAGDAECTIPCRIELDPGEHTVVVRGAREEQRVVTIARREELRVDVDASAVVAEPVDVAPPSEAAITVAASEPAAAEVVPVAAVVAAPLDEVREGWQAFGVLTAVGGGLAAVGVAGIAGFGVRTRDLRAQYDAMPTSAIADEGDAMRDLTNASIGVATFGALLVVVDVVLLFVDPPRTAPRRASIEHGTLRIEL